MTDVAARTRALEEHHAARARGASRRPARRSPDGVRGHARRLPARPRPWRAAARRRRDARAPRAPRGPRRGAQRARPRWPRTLRPRDVTDWTIIELDDPSAVAKLSLPPRIAGARRRRRSSSRAACRAPSPPAGRSASPPSSRTTRSPPELAAFVEKEPLWREAEERLAGGGLAARAQTLLERILALDPQDAPARFNLAAAPARPRRRRGGARRARADPPRVQRRGRLPRERRPHPRGARAPDDAIAAYQRALELLPDDALRHRAARRARRARAGAGRGGQRRRRDARRVRGRRARGPRAARRRRPVPRPGGRRAARRRPGRPRAVRGRARARRRAGRRERAALAGVALGAARPAHRGARARSTRHLAAEPASLVGHATRAQVLPRPRAPRRGRRGGSPHARARPEPARRRAGPRRGRRRPRGRARADARPRRRAPALVGGTPGRGRRRLDARRRRRPRSSTGRLRSTSAPTMRRSPRSSASSAGQGRMDELCEIADGVTRLSEREPGLRWNVASGYARGRPHRRGADRLRLDRARRRACRPSCGRRRSSEPASSGSGASCAARQRAEAAVYWVVGESRLNDDGDSSRGQRTTQASRPSGLPR